MNSNESDDMRPDERLVLCIWSSENEEAKRILEETVPCDLTNSISGKTLLHVAVDSENVTIAKYLIDKGCKVDVVDNKGDTPLILACKFNYTDVIKLLIEAKASVLVSNDEGKSAAEIVLGGMELNFHILDPFLKSVREECSNDSLRTAKELLRIGCSLTRALRLKDPAITKYMLENGCNVNNQDHSLQGWTPLHQALIFRDNENAKLLIERGADVNVEDVHGLGPVSQACNLEILEILLNKGAKVVDDTGTLVAPGLFYCWGRPVVEMLIERYNLRDFSIKDKRGTTLFHHIVSNEAFDAADILQKHFNYSIDINQKDHRGISALLSAVKNSNVRTVEFLLKRGAKFTTEVWDGELYYAVTHNYLKENREENRKNRENILMLLLQYGADIQWTDDDGRENEYCTLDFVLREKHFAMAKIILARLALVEVLGIEIKNLYRVKIEGNAMCKKYFEFCKRTIETLKRAVIKRRVTLFDFMTCSEETLVKFARSEDFVSTVQLMMYSKRNAKLYYYKVLRQRVKKAAEVINLRKDLFWYMNYLMPELQSNRIVIEKIVEYIIYNTMWFMARDPTFKCMIDN